MPNLIQASYRALSAFLLAALLLCATETRGQASTYIPVDDPVYGLLETASTRGLLTALNPTSLPYTHAEVLGALDQETAQDADGLLARIRSIVAPLGSPHQVGVTFRPGLQATNNGRLDAMRLRDRSKWLYPFGDLGLHWQDGPVVAQAALRHDMYWEFDPDGLDATLRAYMRTHEAYVGLMTERASLLIGRIGTHWGAASGPGLLLSDNARPFDGLHLRIGGPTLSLRAIVGELDSITGDGRFTGTAGDDSVGSGSERRWMMAHRLDWRVSNRLRLSFLEGVLFSGPNTGFSLKYLNPAQLLILAVDNRPKNDENNAFLGVGIWARPGRWVVESQLMLDDLDLLLGNEFASFAFDIGVRRAVRSAAVRGRLTVVASRTYNTFQPEGRWTYLDRGLAAQFSDYVSGWVGAILPPVRGSLVLEPYAAFLWQGERDIRDPYRFDDTFDGILVGTVERTFRLAVRGDLNLGGWAYAHLDAGLNRVVDFEHQAGRTTTQGVVVAAVGVRWSASGFLGGSE